jgi:hypothetical protein
MRINHPKMGTDGNIVMQGTDVLLPVDEAKWNGQCHHEKVNSVQIAPVQYYRTTT